MYILCQCISSCCTKCNIGAYICCYIHKHIRCYVHAYIICQDNAGIGRHIKKKCCKHTSITYYIQNILDAILLHAFLLQY